MQSTYTYTNDIGERKMLCVDEQDKSGKYHITLWSLRTGDFCGTGDLTRTEIEELLGHYGVTI